MPKRPQKVCTMDDETWPIGSSSHILKKNEDAPPCGVFSCALWELVVLGPFVPEILSTTDWGHVYRSSHRCPASWILSRYSSTNGWLAGVQRRSLAAPTLSLSSTTAAPHIFSPAASQLLQHTAQLEHQTQRSDRFIRFFGTSITGRWDRKFESRPQIVRHRRPAAAEAEKTGSLSLTTAPCLLLLLLPGKLHVREIFYYYFSSFSKTTYISRRFMYRGAELGDLGGCGVWHAAGT
jgi:hypothetical protein